MDDDVAVDRDWTVVVVVVVDGEKHGDLDDGDH